MATQLETIGSLQRRLSMAVTVPLAARLLKKNPTARNVRDIIAEYYAGERFVVVRPFDDAASLNEGFFDPLGANDTNRNDIFVFGNDHGAAGQRLERGLVVG
jgi:N-acetyl-gamma-glutamyl-phosphate reductase